VCAIDLDAARLDAREQTEEHEHETRKHRKKVSNCILKNEPFVEWKRKGGRNAQSGVREVCPRVWHCLASPVKDGKMAGIGISMV